MLIFYVDLAIWMFFNMFRISLAYVESSGIGSISILDPVRVSISTRPFFLFIDVSVVEIEPMPDDSVVKYIGGLNGPSKRRSRRLRRLDGPFNTIQHPKLCISQQSHSGTGSITIITWTYSCSPF